MIAEKRRLRQSESKKRPPSSFAGIEQVLEPADAIPEELVIAEGVLHRIVHHRHDRQDRREGDDGEDRQDEEPGAVVRAACPCSAPAVARRGGRPRRCGSCRASMTSEASSPSMARFSGTLAASGQPRISTRAMRARPRSSMRRTRDGKALPFRPQRDEFGSDAELDRLVPRQRRVAARQGDRLALDIGRRALDAAGQHVHARRADEMADEGVRRPLEQLLGRSGLHHRAVVHHDDLVGEGERLGLVVRHVDHGEVEASGAAPSGSSEAAI